MQDDSDVKRRLTRVALIHNANALNQLKEYVASRGRSKGSENFAPRLFYQTTRSRQHILSTHSTSTMASVLLCTSPALNDVMAPDTSSGRFTALLSLAAVGRAYTPKRSFRHFTQSSEMYMKNVARAGYDAISFENVTISSTCASAFWLRLLTMR